MKIDEYIEKIKEHTRYYTDIEKLRYVYLNLGKIMSFNIEFAYGTEREKIRIYNNCINDIKELNKSFEDGIVICKSLAYILKYILNKLNIKTEINIYYQENIPYKHVNNIVTIDGEKYIIDLQQDLENIHIHSTTDFFMVDTFEYPVISKNQLKKIDEKIGYVSDDNPYIEEYLYIIRKKLNNSLKLDEKVEVILSELINHIDFSTIRYYELKKAYQSLLLNLLEPKERIYIKFIDGYKMGIQKEYNLFIFVNNNIYMCDNNKFNKITLYDTSLLVKNGYVLLGDIPLLKKILKKEKI